MKHVYVLSAIYSDYEWSTNYAFAAFMHQRRADQERKRVQTLLEDAENGYEVECSQRQSEFETLSYDDEEKLRADIMCKCFKGLPYGLHEGTSHPGDFDHVAVDKVPIVE
jgi:hypothetical protein